MSKPGFRSLTASEQEKLPRCRWSWDTHAKCVEQIQPPETKTCLKCCMEALLNDLAHVEGASGSIHILDGLAAMLKELKLLE